MLVRKTLGLKGIMNFSGHHLPWLTLWACIITIIYEIVGWKWIAIPWLPISVVGIAVAFYVGFKNNQSYDRLWEARKIWSVIESASKAFGSNLNAYISNKFSKSEVPAEKLDQIKRKLIYAHITWLYSLRKLLLIPTEWEHINQSRMVARFNRKRMQNRGIGMVEDELSFEFVKKAFSDEEITEIKKKRCRTTHLIEHNSTIIKELRNQDIIEDFRHIELQNNLNQFRDLQAQCERIKQFPLPRQYGAMSIAFVGIFIFLLPFSMVSEFAKLGDWGTWLSIPFTVLVNWIFITMELVGDYSENPFEGLSNDIPMLSICRKIEIDLLELIDEQEIPELIKPKKGILL